MFANNSWTKRILHLIGATVALIVTQGGSWWPHPDPASSRPYIGGSTDNTFMDLVLGYNGIGRISGGNGGGPGGGGGQAGGSFGGSTGLSRLFSSEMGNGSPGCCRWRCLCWCSPPMSVCAASTS